MARPDTTRFSDLPILSPLWRQHDRREQIARILKTHDHGYFVESAGLVDEILTDDRISGVTSTRAGGLLAAPFEVRASGPRRKESKIAEVLGGDGSDVQGIWREMVAPSVIRDMLTWGWFLGVGVAEIVWAKTKREWRPRLVPWHPRFVRWDWMTDRFVLMTLEGEVALPRPDEQPFGDGKWFMWCPWGVKYGWRRSMIRSLADKYLMRQWTERDWARYCEKHGMAIVEAKVPANASQEDKDRFFDGVANLGNEAAIESPQGAKDEPSFGLELHEAQAKTHETFETFKRSLDVDIAVHILGQNLTSDVQGGSRAAAQVHNLVRLDKAGEDAEIGPALRAQVFSWWTEYNYGDRDLTPYVEFQVAPPDDELAEAQAFESLGTAMVALDAACPGMLDKAAILDRHGIPMLPESEWADEEGTPPVPPPGTPPAPGTPVPPPAGTPPPEGSAGDEGGKPEGETPRAPGAAKAKLAALSASPALASLRTSKRITAGPRKPAAYIDKLDAAAAKHGARVIGRDLEGITADIRACTSYEDLKARVLHRFKHMEPTALADAVKKARVMAHLSGRGAVLDVL